MASRDRALAENAGAVRIMAVLNATGSAGVTGSTLAAKQTVAADQALDTACFGDRCAAITVRSRRQIR